MRMITGILDILFPPRCAFCGRLMECSGNGVCPDCEEELPYIGGDKCVRFVGDFRCAVALYYEDLVMDGVHSLKFGRKSNRAAVFGRYIAKVAAEQFAGEFDEVTYVPVSWKRNFTRGFDQARLLARAAAGVWGMREVSSLKKVRHTRAQSSLNDAVKRKENVKGVYRVPRPERVRGRRFLLVDDVATTGSTLAAGASALMEAGAASVVCATLAGGHRHIENSVTGQTMDRSDG